MESRTYGQQDLGDDAFDLLVELKTTRATSEAFPLRPHQRSAWEAIVGHWGTGKRRVCAVAPTGAGKSRLGREAAMSARHPLCVVHTKALQVQNSSTVCRTLTVQGLLSSVKRIGLEKTRELVGPVDLVIHDEAHHFCAKKWAQLHEVWPNVRVLGLTATPERGDGSPMRPYYDALVKVSNYEDLIRAGFLVPARVVNEHGDAISSDDEASSKRTSRTERATAASAYMELCNDSNMRAIVYCEDRQHADETSKELTAHGVSNRLVLGVHSDQEREQALADFTSGVVSVLVNVDVLVEGVDLPCTQAVILWISCGTVGRYLQVCGRALRPYPGKTEALIVDISGASKEFGSPSANREYSLDGKAISCEPAGYKLLCGTCSRGFGIQGPAPRDEETGEIDLTLLNPKEVPRDENGAPRCTVFRREPCSEQTQAWVAGKSKERVARLTELFQAKKLLLTRAEYSAKVKTYTAWPKRLDAYLGSEIWIADQPATGGTMCPHCSSERPRSTRAWQGQPMLKDASTVNVVPANGIPKSWVVVLRDCMLNQKGRGACLTAALVFFRTKYDADRVPGQTLEQAFGALLKVDPELGEYQKRYLAKKIAGGWKPGAAFMRQGKFERMATPSALNAARDAVVGQGRLPEQDLTPPPF